MEALIDFLFVAAIIATGLLIMNIENSLLALVLLLALFISIIAGGIYAVGIAIGETSTQKY